MHDSTRNRMSSLLLANSKSLTRPPGTSKPACFSFRYSRLFTNFPVSTDGHSTKAPRPSDHPQDLLPSRNRAFMGSHSPQGVHHDHHPLRSTATRRALGLVTQDTGAMARHRYLTKVHTASWQGHLPTVRHRGLRKRVPVVIDCRVPKAHQAVRAPTAVPSWSYPRPVPVPGPGCHRRAASGRQRRARARHR